MYALLPDGVEVYDLRKGGFIQDRTVKGARFIGMQFIVFMALLSIAATAGTRVFVATGQDVCLLHADNFNEDDIRRPGVVASGMY